MNEKALGDTRYSAENLIRKDQIKQRPRSSMANAKKSNVFSRPITATTRVSAGGILKNRNLGKVYQSFKNLNNMTAQKRFDRAISNSSKLQ